MRRLIFVLMSIFLFVGSANAITKHKKIEKTFKAGENLRIESKYSKIQIKHWDKNEIRFEVLISVEGSNEEKTKKMANNITIDFTEGEKQLLAKTVLGDFFSLKKLTNSLFNKGKIKIKYTVQVPSNVNLDIVQKNGDVFMDNHDANVNLDLTSGNFTAQNLMGENSFTITGCTFKAQKLNDSKLIVANSKVTIENAEKISGESRDSEFKIQVIDNLNIKSARDKFDIKEIEYLYGSSNFSKIEISQMGGEIDYDQKFGHINVFNINNMFSFIKIDSKHGDVGLSFMEGCQIEYEINHKSVKFDNAADFKLSNEPTADKNTFIAKGRVGDKKAFSKLNIRANNCKMRLQ
ncbi:hypothetical protein L3049_08735 [Labilibaculum sp. DW002]|jgi:hypothetical protein|uniref:Adhesin domain-containing protein n=1 Tax=Paralabilibaculum antarcticum TaxID=2912572 RepID=A0ABT5VUC1_9BACT|nr:hypothetical protein [Labilibaculum sp. DW002]MDE5418093.1 hypothetical protein [Labilibaculum sp. DW002]